MGKVVSLADLSAAPVAGVARAPITNGDTRQMSAEYLRIEPGSTFSAQAPAAADTYLFALAPGCTVTVDGHAHAMPAQTFATIGEGTAYRVQNGGSAAVGFVLVTAPPGGARDLPGFAGKLAVAERLKTEIVSNPEQRKQRIYFAGGHGAATERGHAMIVVYDGETDTPLHLHPNADSMFVLLDGAVEFTVNGKAVVAGPGQVAYFPTNDQHALHTAPGHAGASFLEFHVPARFATVKA